MSKRKCLSSDEKKSRMLQIFHETKEVFQLKELEKIAPNEKGITVQTVKDVLQSLVDDGLVDTDKIGTSVYYWSFPSKGLHVKKNKLETEKHLLEDLRKKCNVLHNKVEIEKKQRTEDSYRAELLTKYEKIAEEEKKLKTEVQLLSEQENLIKLKSDTKSLLEAANRWTDNIYTIKMWCKRKFNVDEEQLNKQFNIPELEYLT